MSVLSYFGMPLVVLRAMLGIDKAHPRPKIPLPAAELLLCCVASGGAVELHLDLLFEIAEYWEGVRQRKQLKRGVTSLLHMEVFSHQVPGGISNVSQHGTGGGLPAGTASVVQRAVGHVDILLRSLALFDKVIVAIGIVVIKSVSATISSTERMESVSQPICIERTPEAIIAASVCCRRRLPRE